MLSAAPYPASAQQSAGSLARLAEDELHRSTGISMTFQLPVEGLVTVTVDVRGKRIRIESVGMLVISDGSTLWNLSKSTSHVTIDNVAKTSSPFTDPASLFEFSEHYTAAIVSHSGRHYTLDLTPDVHLASLLKAAGGAEKLTLDLTVNGKTVTIVKAQVSSSRGTQQTSALRITPLKKLRDEDFKLTVTSVMKVTDLRE